MCKVRSSGGLSVQVFADQRDLVRQAALRRIIVGAVGQIPFDRQRVDLSRAGAAALQQDAPRERLVRASMGYMSELLD